MNNNQSDRSMIEMLGVLAIIGVLSVGGIAGYSKAMEKFKLDKAADEYTHIIFGLLEHLDDIRKISDSSGTAYGFGGFSQRTESNSSDLAAYRQYGKF